MDIALWMLCTFRYYILALPVTGTGLQGGFIGVLISSKDRYKHTLRIKHTHFSSFRTRYFFDHVQTHAIEKRRSFQELGSEPQRLTTT